MKEPREQIAKLWAENIRSGSVMNKIYKKSKRKPRVLFVNCDTDGSEKDYFEEDQEYYEDYYGGKLTPFIEKFGYDDLKARADKLADACLPLFETRIKPGMDVVKLSDDITRIEKAVKKYRGGK